MTLLLNRWVWLGALLLALSGVTWAYLGERDKVAAGQERLEHERAASLALQKRLNDVEARNEQLEQARVALAAEVQELRVQRVEIVTRIREVYRDRPVPMEPEVEQCMPLVAPHLPVECGGIATPAGVLGMQCAAAGSLRGACAPSDSG